MELAMGGIFPSPEMVEIGPDDGYVTPLYMIDRLMPRESGQTVFGSAGSAGWSFTTVAIDGDELSHRKALQLFVFGPVNPHAALVMVPKSDRFGARLSWQMRCAAAAFVKEADDAVGPLARVMQFLAEVGRQWREEDWAARPGRRDALRDYRRKIRRRNRRRR